MPDMTPEQLIAAGVGHHQAGRLAEAAEIYRQILAQKPDHADALHLAGVLAAQTARHDLAIELITRAIAVSPGACEFHRNLGNVYRESGRLQQAAAAFERAIEIKPNSVEDCQLLGKTLLELGRFEPAVAAYRRAYRVRPDLPQIAGPYRAALLKAVDHLRSALGQHPADIDVHRRLAALLQENGETDAAIALLHSALRILPGLADLHTQLGVALDLKGELDDAVVAHIRALAINPVLAEAHFNLGHAYGELGRATESATFYAEAARLKADWAEAHWNLALALLVIGDFKRGWAEYEWRWRLPGTPSLLHNARQPIWDGSDFKGKTLLLRAEQGFGDTIQFIRYAPLVGAKRGKGCSEVSAGVIAAAGGGGRVEHTVTDGDVAFDLHCTLVRLPLIFQTELQTIPAGVPYLKADAALAETWGKKIAGAPGRLKVGLAWAGLPSHHNDRDRSLTLSSLAPLASSGEIDFYSLQKGPAAVQAVDRPPAMRLIDYCSDLHDFADTAALIAHLDLVICVDTAIAHLAGAMGKPVWVMLPFKPDWRWLVARADSPWYPTMRLFRQRSRGDWTAVVQSVAGALTIFRAQTFERDRQQHAAAPQLIESHYRRGMSLAASGRRDEAIAAYRETIKLKSDHAHAWNNLGNLLVDQRQFSAAIDAYHAATAADPAYAPFFYNLGIALCETGAVAEGIDAYREALRLKPDFFIAMNNLGNALKRLDRVDEAIDAYRSAIALKPDYAEAQNNFGVSLLEKKQIVESIAAHACAVQLKPDNPHFHYNLGVALEAAGKMDEAIAAYQRAVQLWPGYPEAHYNLARLWIGKKDLSASIAAYERAIAHRPQWPEAHYNLALTLLLNGNLPRGWDEYEWRWQAKDFPSKPRDRRRPMWDGNPLAGRTILLHAEQGLGDTIQFIRYAPRVAELGGRVIVECAPLLARLISGVRGVEQVITTYAPPPFDVHCPLLSLPRIFGTQLNSIPAETPYIEVDEATAETWRQKISPESPALKIGLVWAGAPNHRNDSNRSVALAQLAPLASAAGNAIFYSLQKGPAASEGAHAPAGMKLVDLTSAISDLADTAALILQMDLIIAVDTSVAHLAGALGKPVWVLLPANPDWRWMLDREDSPWYPTMRLFRQHYDGDKTGAIARMKAELARFAALHASRK